MKALLSTEKLNAVFTQVVDHAVPEPKQGQVLIKAEYSSINFKDALAVTGKGKIFKALPLIGGIDVSGTVEASKAPNIKKGDYVLITGCGLGETHDGGYSQYVVDYAQNVITRNKNLSAREAMIYGTAGFTAALCLERLLQNGQTPEMGPILVTGATGGVGQFAITFFSKMGFEVHALTSKRELVSRLKEIGAKEVIFTSQLTLGDRPLETVRYGGAVDSLGGTTLSKILAHVQLWGNVASVGLADTFQLQSTVMPFILRGVSLIGISSNNTPLALRQKIWQRLANDLKPANLESYVNETVGLNDVLNVAQRMLSRQTYGRTLVDLSK